MNYCVNIQCNVNFEFADGVDQEQLLDEFCETIFETDMRGFHRFIAEQIASGNRTFIEGVGPIGDKFWKGTDVVKDCVLYFDIDQHTTDVDVQR